MSTDSFSGSSPKRFRPDCKTPSDFMALEDANGHISEDSNPSGSDYRPHEIRHFDGLSSKNDCVVEGAHSGRHLFSSPQYATAAVTNTNDTELLNGDSGFQELNIPEELNLDGSNVDNNKKESIRPEHAIADFNSEDSISEISCVSDISNISGENWKPVNENIKWVEKQMQNGSDPREIIRVLLGGDIDENIDEISAWRFIIRVLNEPTARPKLPSVNSIDDVIRLIEKSSKIIVLTGAGVSVSCGIPDFRSRNGIYARLSKDYPDLPDPQSMFDIHYFKRNPHPFFKFAKEIYPGQFSPSPSHKFIKYIERKGKLLRNYSQNIDTLEKAAGIEKVITCHGSFATASCTNCGFKVDSNAIKNDIFAQCIPQCNRCTSEEIVGENVISVMKPDIVFFGEGLSDEFHSSMSIDKDECDLLIVIGSSLKVRPVALIPNAIPHNIPQILINREPLNHFNFDVELLGDCDVIIRHLCERLGSDWSDFCFTNKSISNEAKEENVYRFIPTSRYIFQGAEICDIENDDSEDSDDEKIYSETENESLIDETNTTNNSQDNQHDSSNEFIYQKNIYDKYFNPNTCNNSQTMVDNKKIDYYTDSSSIQSKMDDDSTNSSNNCLKRKSDSIDQYALDY